MSNPSADKHYRDHPDYYRERNAVRRAAMRKFVREYKESHPCVDCGIQYPHYVMQFDHLHDKTANIGNLKNSTTLPRLQEEIAKCEVVCANCHATRTYSPLV